MKDHFLQFETLCASCEPVLELLLQTVRERRIPDTALIRQGAELLDGIGSTVQAIRDELQSLSGESSLPTTVAAITEYVKARSLSALRDRDQVRRLAEDTLRIHSDDPYYAQAFAPLAAQARTVLDALRRTPEASLPADPAVFELLVTLCQASQPLSGSMLLRAEESGKNLPRPVLIGLLNGKYRLDAPTAESASVVTPVSVIVPEPVVTPEPVIPPAPAPIPEAAAKPVPDPVVAEPETPVEPVRYIHPIRPIQPPRLPTEQALEEVFQETSPVMARLLDKLAFLGMMDTAHLHAYLQRYPTDAIDRAVSLLELRGYIATYAWQGRAIICFTEQMKACLQRRSLHETLRRLMRGRPLLRILRTALQDMPQDAFLQHLQRVDLHHAFITALRKHPDLLTLLPASGFTEEAGFSMTLRLDGMPDQTLALIRSTMLAGAVPVRDMGLIACADALPAMDGVTDECRFCLTPSGLHQYRGGSWAFIVA